MKKTTIEEFQAELQATGTYKTKDDHKAPKLAKKSWWTTVRFSWGVTSVFPKCGFYEPLGLLTQPMWGKFCFKSIQTAEALGMTVSVEGFENLRDLKEPAVILSNHMSTAETIMLPPILLAHRPLSYVAKASLAHLPFLEKAAAHMGMVPIGRVSPREDLVNMLKAGSEKLQGGSNFLIFPQGTRCEVFSRKKYSSIGAKIAEKAGSPIVPVVVDTRCQPTRKSGFWKKIFKDMGTVDPSMSVRIAIGPAIPVGKSKDMHEAAFTWMADKIESWGMPVER